MAISEAFAGNPTVTNVEYDLPSASTSLSAQTTDGIYQLFIDLNALVTGDEFKLRIYEKVQSSSTQRVVQEVTFYNAQSPEFIYVSASMLLLHGWTMTLQRTQGSNRAIPFSIRAVT